MNVSPAQISVDFPQVSFAWSQGPIFPDGQTEGLISQGLFGKELDVLEP